MAGLAALGSLPALVEDPILRPAPDERPAAPLVRAHARDLVRDRALPPAPPQPDRDALDQVGWNRAQLARQSLLPLLEDAQRREPVAIERTRFHLGTDRVLAQRIEHHHPIGQPLHGARVRGAPASVDEDDHRLEDRRQQPRLLALLPPQELVGVRDVEAVEKGCHLQLGTGVVRQDSAGLETAEVHRHDAVRQADGVPCGLQRLPSELGPQHRDGGGQRMPALRGRRPGPEEVGQVITAVRRALLHTEVDQERDVLLHPKANGIAVRSEQGRRAESAEKEPGVHGIWYGCWPTLRGAVNRSSNLWRNRNISQAGSPAVSDKSKNARRAEDRTDALANGRSCY